MEAQNGSMTLTMEALRLKMGPGIRGGSVDQRSQICITFLKRGIRIRIRVLRWIHMRSMICIRIRVKSLIRIDREIRIRIIVFRIRNNGKCHSGFLSETFFILMQYRTGYLPFCHCFFTSIPARNMVWLFHNTHMNKRSVPFGEKNVWP